MAKNYNDIYTAVYTKNNKMDFGNSMIRGNAIPLDITEVYNSYSVAEAYVNSNPVAYEGQLLAVTENNDTTVYVIAARLAEDGVTVEHYLKEVGSTPEVDGVTIQIIDGKLTAIIPETDLSDYVTKEELATLTQENANRFDELEEKASQKVDRVDVYITSEVDSIVEGIEAEIATKANATEVYTKSEIDDIVEEHVERFDDLESKVSNKIDAVEVYTKSEVYTKTETDTKIGEAVAAADHLKRIVLDAPEAGETEEDVINEWIEVNEAEDVADQYIYMLPTGLQESDNKYREYIVIIDGENSYIEQVGNWEVDLSEYLKSADAESTYATITKVNEAVADFAVRSDELEDKISQKVDRIDVYTISEANNKFATKVDLENYDTAEEVANTYATKEEVENTFGDYATAEEIAEGYVAKEDLATTLESYAKTEDIPTDYVSEEEFAQAMTEYDKVEVADGKYADKTTTEEALGNMFTKVEVGNLLDTKVDKTVATAEDGIRFINQTEISKLSKLNLDGDDITISGSVNASQVKELYPTVVNIIKGAASDLDPDTDGNQLGLGIQEGAQVNFINNINTDVFSVDSDKKLDLVKVSVGKLDGLDAWIEENRDVVIGLYPTAAATLLSSLDNIVNNETDGLVTKLTAINAKVITVEETVEDHTERIEALEYAMTWHDMENN